MKLNQAFFAKLTCLCLLCLASPTTSAQDEPRKFDLGLIGGVNFDQHKATGHLTPITANPPAAAGYHAGVFFNLPVAGHWKLFSELQYIRRGTRSVYPSVPLGQRISFEYIHLPVLVGVEVTKVFTIEAGPSLDTEAQLLGSSRNSEKGDRLQVGINTGFRFAFHPRISFLCRYYQAISPFERVSFDSGANQTGTTNYFHRTFQLSMAYRVMKL